eukprot:2412925-Ditylum_brightwellii.AAC.1
MMQSLTHVTSAKLHSPLVSSKSTLDRPVPPPLLMMPVTNNLNGGDKCHVEDELQGSNHQA